MKNKRLKFAAATSVAALILLIGASLAYFTDNTTGTATGTAGTVKISIDTASFNLLNPDGDVDNFNPGDGRLISAAITNEGNKSVDVRATYRITMKPTAPVTDFTALPSDEGTPMGWTLFDAADCTLDDTTGNYAVNPGATPIAVPAWTKNGDGTFSAIFAASGVITLNGTGAGAEIDVDEGSNKFDSGGHVLAMLADSDNSYQAAVVTLDILAEAKQHRNTSGISWSQLETQTVAFGGGSATAVVVPDAGTRGGGASPVTSNA